MHPLRLRLEVSETPIALNGREALKFPRLPDQALGLMQQQYVSCVTLSD